jgi:hypothetical protein
MPSTLTQLRARVAARLVDAAHSVFSADTLDEALRSALSDYTAAAPCGAEAVLVLPAASRKIALAGLDDLITVTGVWWPYHSTAEAWPPRQVRGFRLWFDDGQPMLFLSTLSGAMPQAGDELRLWYTKAHTISGLDGAVLSSLPAHHESGIVTGAAAYAAASEHIDQVGAVHIDRDEQPALQAWSAARFAEFSAFLDRVRASAPTHGEPFGPGWALDRYDHTRR